VTIECRDIPEFINEAGGHRWQELSGTGKKARIHTSTVTCSVLMSTDEPKTLSVPDSDLEIKFHRSSGPGGQRKNKVATCCVVTHLPTGMTQKADGRSRLDNEFEAKEKIRARLGEIAQNGGHHATNLLRSQQIGCGARGDKRRTYRFQDNMIYDQVCGKTTTCNEFMKGNIDRLW
jgi:peptide chain release factor 1